MTDWQPVERHHRITNNNAIDLHVGKRLRLRRTLLGMSQIFDVPVSYIFDDMSETTMRSSPRRVARGVDDGGGGDGEVKDPMARRETLELVRSYYTIEQPAVRKRVSDMVRSIATALTGV